jgi:hypothetical protein
MDLGCTLTVDGRTPSLTKRTMSRWPVLNPSMKQQVWTEEKERRLREKSKACQKGENSKFDA